MASADHCLKFGLRSSTSSWFGSYFVNMYAPVEGGSFVPRSLLGVPHGSTDACGTASLSSHSASGFVRWNVTVPAFVVDHDALGEIAGRGRLEALVGADEDAVEAARRRGVHLEDALERPQEVARLHRRAGRVLDALAQLERPRLAAVGRLRQGDGEIRHEREGLRPLGVLERDQPVLRGLVELPVLERVVDLRVERAGGALGQQLERAAAVLGHQLCPAGRLRRRSGAGRLGHGRTRGPDRDGQRDRDREKLPVVRHRAPSARRERAIL